MAQELLACRRQRRATFVPNEERPAKQLFEVTNPRADRRLSNIQALGGSNKTSR